MMRIMHTDRVSGDENDDDDVVVLQRENTFFSVTGAYYRVK